MLKIHTQLLDATSAKAKASARKRMNHNFHTELTDTLQRMLNALEPDTYIRPHKHENPDKHEVFILLRGKAAAFEFDDTGNVTDTFILDPLQGNFGVEIAPKVWHTVISLAENSMVYELKDGPYQPIDDKNFASWSPEETSDYRFEYLQSLRKKIGY